MRNWIFRHIDFSTYPFYEKDDLGVSFTDNRLRVKIWAPTANCVEFRLYEKSSGGKPIRIEDLLQSKNGTWELTLQANFRGLYYTFKVNDGEWLQETPGPDARATGANGKRGLIFDPGETNPVGWENDESAGLENPVDAIVYELHIRDFSIDPDSGINKKGKFMAFTERGTTSPDGLSTGIDHLKELGITHVQLLPVADFYTVDENFPDESYNWGYDPLNYNCPEGSYASNPNDTSRILELKKLIMSLHSEGIGVIMDVVYNHTGLTKQSYFNQTVPGYYYRQKENGYFANASGCGNEIASERSMVRKYIINSLKYWVEEFHVDGFRFDLMGIHDIETMNQVRIELVKVKPGILLYGEGWAADKSPMDEQFRAIKSNAWKLNGIGCFNNDIRDAVKGDNFNAKSKGFVNGKTLGEESIKIGIVAACYHPQIRYGPAEAWALEPSICVNYIACHDNFTLFDKLQLSCPDADLKALKRMQKLAGALLLTSQGIPFLHAGIEFCRSKKGDHNSYKSPDFINQINWSLKNINHDVYSYYKKLIELRKKIPAFRFRSSEEIRRFLKFSSNFQPGVAAYTINEFPNNFNWKTIQLIFNAKEHEISFELPNSTENWKYLALEDEINIQGISNCSNPKVLVPPISMMILVEET